VADGTAVVQGALLAGVDIGTTGVRCIVFDRSGRRVSDAYEEYPLEELGDGRVEQSVPQAEVGASEGHVVHRALTRGDEAQRSQEHVDDPL
jgi:glycerol kinase